MQWTQVLVGSNPTPGRDGFPRWELQQDCNLNRMKIQRAAPYALARTGLNTEMVLLGGTSTMFLVFQKH